MYVFEVTIYFRLELLENKLSSTYVNHRYMSREEFVFINLKRKNASQNTILT